jgi:hypothetical protein
VKLQGSDGEPAGMAAQTAAATEVDRPSAR